MIENTNNTNFYIPDGFYKDENGIISKKECSCGKINQDIDNCTDCNPKKNIGISGWICPVCGRGCSPQESYCSCIGSFKDCNNCANFMPISNK